MSLGVLLPALLLLAATPPASSSSASAHASSVLVFTAPDGSVRQVDAWGDNSLRVRIAPKGGAIVAVPPAQGLLPTAPASSASGSAARPAVLLRADGLGITNGNIALALDATRPWATS